ncbi:MAG: hydrogenase expression/formation protein HypE [Desulfobacterales bacterium]|nr:hydrogenase expression/formation protein HypE [Desulfobacterales bacterium]
MSKKITLAHGSGGKATNDLIRELFVAGFNSDALAPMEDCALLSVGGGRLAFSTDSFVVDPIFFPGGDIGVLAVHGTINDLAMRGARPAFLSLGLIIEEGFPYDHLVRLVRSIKGCADRAGVEIVTGDTKVVPAGKADKIFINTAGIGILEHDLDISCENGRPGDKIILSGTMADHGTTILCLQEGLKIQGGFSSDSAPLHTMVKAMLETGQDAIHVLRDPTRGGVGTALNELAQASKVGLRIHENALPVRDDVRGACELLGLDPLFLANEGKLLAFVAPDRAETVLAAVRREPAGIDARIIGEAVAAHPGEVVLETGIGGRRLIEMLQGEALPRIC